MGFAALRASAGKPADCGGLGVTPAHEPSAAVAIDSRSANAPRTKERRLFVGVFEVRVAVQAVFIESQQAA